MAVAVDAEEAVALTQALVRIDTRNPPGAEDPAIDLLEHRLAAAGFHIDRVPYPDGPGRSHLVARWKGSGNAPGVMVSGHVDVVPPGELAWSEQPFGGEIRDGQLYGRGSCDMKSGVAALVVAAESLVRTGKPLRGDLVVCLTADEERYCLGAEALVREPLFAGLGSVIVAEPTGLRLFVAEKGAFCVQVRFRGRTAHGSMPELGANAISAMADFLARWEREFPSDVEPHPLLGRPTLNVGMVQGGVKVNVVPDQCVAQLDMRTTPALDHQVLRARLEETLAAAAQGRAGVSYEYQLLFERPPVSCPPDSRLASALAEAAEAIAGVDPEPAGVPYCTEACIWTPELGLDAVICGPGDPGMAHQPNESVPVEQVKLATRVYARALARLLLEEER